MSPEATYLLESLGTVLLFGGATWIAVATLRKAGGGRRSDVLEVVAREPLDARRAVYLVRVGTRVLVVGAGEGGLRRLGVTTMAALGLDASSARPPSTFGAQLARVLGRRPPASDSQKPEGD